MCGRFVSSRRPEDLASLFGADWQGEPVPPSWNVAPTDPVYAVLERLAKDGSGPARQVRVLRWGLVPSWSKDPGGGARMINARVETVDSKPAFRKAFTARRCLLPADGYFEWVPVDAPGAKPRKQPYYLTPASGELMAMAGLYEFWRDPNVPEDDPAAWLTTCTVITTDAADASGRVHDRMPLTVAPDAHEAWLDPAHQDPHALRALLAVPAGGELEVREVSTEVNSVRNNGARLIAPLG
ncbi:SOS response-associated peptidase [Streptacidiphilus sp. P02-A3a]|uniref:SOS response-associated peptidase n=1 Tax=Streptacidiphilus sp. P02-A3a TaxID=2704468 RepID=UPI0015FAD9D8|nr:SOS response-associated peptidase [Streptacidiphilus sp. P02-A3a]QMU70488.1 SOS response-associated peptidase [Streptacidiphilus sp. P02-A3a]